MINNSDSHTYALANQFYRCMYACICYNTAWRGLPDICTYIYARCPRTCSAKGWVCICILSIKQIPTCCVATNIFLNLYAHVSLFSLLMFLGEYTYLYSIFKSFKSKFFSHHLCHSFTQYIKKPDVNNSSQILSQLQGNYVATVHGYSVSYMNLWL